MYLSDRPYYETSAKDNTNVEAAFMCAAELLTKSTPQIKVCT